MLWGGQEKQELTVFLVLFLLLKLDVVSPAASLGTLKQNSYDR